MAKIPTQFIARVNIGTTIATNALLERKGATTAIVVSQGFPDLLTIRNQARPNIFDLKCQKPEPLTHHIFAIDSRIYRHKVPLHGGSLVELKPEVYEQSPSTSCLSSLISSLKLLNPASLGISLCNSYLNPHPELTLEQFLRPHCPPSMPIYLGSNYVDLGYLKRTETLLLDCYLNPMSTSLLK
jgi:N-methylhydantoinase A/oxoprolinase/acetone carboxylase beta subunit